MVNDGGSAFPQPVTPLHAELGNTVGEGGMSLRDWFAGMGLAGFVQLTALITADRMMSGMSPQGLPSKETAMRAYAFADAMLTERAKTAT